MQLPNKLSTSSPYQCNLIQNPKHISINSNLLHSYKRQQPAYLYKFPKKPKMKSNQQQVNRKQARSFIGCIRTQDISKIVTNKVNKSRSFHDKRQEINRHKVSYEQIPIPQKSVPHIKQKTKIQNNSLSLAIKKFHIKEQKYIRTINSQYQQISQLTERNHQLEKDRQQFSNIIDKKLKQMQGLFNDEVSQLPTGRTNGSKNRYETLATETIENEMDQVQYQLGKKLKQLMKQYQNRRSPQTRELCLQIIRKMKACNRSM